MVEGQNVLSCAEFLVMLHKNADLKIDTTLDFEKMIDRVFGVYSQKKNSGWIEIASIFIELDWKVPETIFKLLYGEHSVPDLGLEQECLNETYKKSWEMIVDIAKLTSHSKKQLH
jgi:hypothetical protein